MPPLGAGLRGHCCRLGITLRTFNQRACGNGQSIVDPQGDVAHDVRIVTSVVCTSLGWDHARAVLACLATNEVPLTCLAYQHGTHRFSGRGAGEACTVVTSAECPAAVAASQGGNPVGGPPRGVPSEKDQYAPQTSLSRGTRW